jgi:hypothetical protein
MLIGPIPMEKHGSSPKGFFSGLVPSRELKR